MSATAVSRFPALADTVAELRHRPVNYDEAQAPPHVLDGWHRDRVAIELGHEEPGEPVPGGLVETGTELQKLYVRREVTGRGLGARLLERVLDEARSEGAALVWLDVLRSNAGARRMYERHGFQVVAELPFATGRGEIGFWVMARRLQG